MFRQDKMRQQITGFATVGALAFLIDAGLLQLIVWLGGNPYIGRLISFTSALIFTWWMNRTYSFRQHNNPGLREFVRYLASVSLGGVVNWGIYLTVIHLWLFDSAYAALAIIPATAASMFCNFMLMKFVVFTEN